MPDSQSSTSPRRNFLGRLASGSVALAATSLFARSANATTTAAMPADDEPWLKAVVGKKHKMVVDGANPNAGFPFMFAATYLGTMTDAYKLAPADINAIVICRHMGVCLALNDHVWAKYNLGKMFGVNDPSTKAPAMRNIFYKPKAGDMLNNDASADKLLARGVVLGACNVALNALSGMASTEAKVTPAAAYADWKANLHPGVMIVPSGVLGVARAQEAGCVYCYGG